MLNVVLVGVSLVGLGALSLLLLLNHPGVAIQFAGYLFYWLIAVFVYEKINS